MAATTKAGAGSVAAITPPAEVTSEQKIAFLPGKASIAVLPFVNMSGDPQQKHFADGITEDINLFSGKQKKALTEETQNLTDEILSSIKSFPTCEKCLAYR